MYYDFWKHREKIALKCNFLRFEVEKIYLNDDDIEQINNRSKVEKQIQNMMNKLENEIDNLTKKAKIMERSIDKLIDDNYSR